MANYFTVQDDAWDLISFKKLGNEFFSDQLIVANSQFNQIVNFDGNVGIQLPNVVAPVSVSPMVWGSTTRIA